jgi:hypothetical protein
MYRSTSFLALPLGRVRFCVDEYIDGFDELVERADTDR